MDNLFTLYRYLVNNQHQSDENNPYNVALRTVECFLDMLPELETHGGYVRTQGGFEWEDVQHITHHLIEGHKTALCVHFDSGLEAVKDFAQSHIDLNKIDALIDALQQQKQVMLKAKEEAERWADDLSDFDDHPF